MAKMQSLDIDMILGALGLSVYSSLLHEKNVPYDAFVNMTRSDMTIVGITNEEHQNVLMNNLKPLRDELHEDLTNSQPFDVQSCLEHVLFQLIILRGSLLAVRKQLNKGEGRLVNFMCDSTTSCGTIINRVTEKCLDSVNLIENDLRSLEEGTVGRRSYSKWTFLGGVISIGVISMYILSKSS